MSCFSLNLHLKLDGPGNSVSQLQIQKPVILQKWSVMSKYLNLLYFINLSMWWCLAISKKPLGKWSDQHPNIPMCEEVCRNWYLHGTTQIQDGLEIGKIRWLEMVCLTCPQLVTFNQSDQLGGQLDTLFFQKTTLRKMLEV